jgi:hypothetical protein
MDFNEYMLSLLKKKSLTERLRGFWQLYLRNNLI